MATTFLDLVSVLIWPLVLSAAAWVIATNALAERDEISKVVHALTGPDEVIEEAQSEAVSLRRSNVSAIASGDERRGDRAAVRRILRDHELLEYASP
jgi:hypothetical protein